MFIQADVHKSEIYPTIHIEIFCYIQLSVELCLLFRHFLTLEPKKLYVTKRILLKCSWKLCSEFTVNRKMCNLNTSCIFKMHKFTWQNSPEFRVEI